MAKRIIITELEDKSFTLVDKKESITLKNSKDFKEIYDFAKESFPKEVIYGITNIKDASERHPKFKDFKTPVRCSYEFN